MSLAMTQGGGLTGMTFHTDAGPQAAASFWVARTVGTDTTRENEVARDSQNSHDGRRSSTHRMTSTDAGHVSRLLLLQAVAHHAYPVSPFDDLGG